MSAPEHTLWYQDYLEEPWDARTISEQIALLITLLANVHRNSKKRKEPFTLEDFLPGNAPKPEIPVETKQQRAARIKSVLLGMYPRRPKKAE